MIIVVGCDNTGKTSLVKHIKDKFEIPEGQRFYSLPPKNEQEWNQWYRHIKAHFILNPNAIYDRFFIDEFVYGPLIRGGYKIGIEKMAELTNLMLIAQPIVIYCWLPLVSLLENYDERGQVFSAYEASQILIRYNEVIDQYPLNLLTNKLIFNYNQDSDYREIDLKLERIL